MRRYAVAHAQIAIAFLGPLRHAAQQKGMVIKMKRFRVEQKASKSVDWGGLIQRMEATCDDLGFLVKKAGFQKSLLVYDTGVRERDLLPDIRAGFSRWNVEVVSYREIQGDVFFSTIDGGYRQYLNASCDSVVCVGGKTAADTGKGIALLGRNGGKIEKYTDPSVRREPGTGIFCAHFPDGGGERHILTLNVWDNKHWQRFAMECYCNYDIRLMAGTDCRTVDTIEQLKKRGVNTECALAHCGGDETLYLQMIRIFLEDNAFLKLKETLNREKKDVVIYKIRQLVEMSILLALTAMTCALAALMESLCHSREEACRVCCNDVFKERNILADVFEMPPLAI